MCIRDRFTFSTKMHERYAFPAIMLLVVGYALLKDKRLLYSAMLLSVSQFVNMALVLQNHDLLSSQQAINVIFSLINIIATSIPAYARGIYAWAATRQCSAVRRTRQ